MVFKTNSFGFLNTDLYNSNVSITYITEIIMIENAKTNCEIIFKKYEDLNAVKQIIYSYAEKLINKLFTDERGEEILVNIEDAELYNRSLEDNGANYDPNTWEHWLLCDINIVNSNIFFSYLNDSATEYYERLEETDIDFLKDVIRYIKKELDRIED